MEIVRINHYIGSPCEAHPELDGLRYKSNGGCLRCNAEYRAKLRQNKHLNVRDYFVCKLAGIKANCNRLGNECNVTVNNLMQVYDKQNGKCAISGIKLKLSGQLYNRLSVDRIEPNLNYTFSNIRFLANSINVARSNSPDEVLIDICKYIITPCRQLISKLNSRINLAINRKTQRSGIDQVTLRGIFNKQQGTCAITRLPFYSKPFSAFEPSVDRINPQLGYISSNVRFMLNAVNCLKLDGDDEWLRHAAIHIINGNR